MIIRELHPDELGKVRELGRRAFALPMGLLMAATVSPQGWAAQDASAYGCVWMVRRAQDRKGAVGILDWAAVICAARGRGSARPCWTRRWWGCASKGATRSSPPGWMATTPPPGTRPMPMGCAIGRRRSRSASSAGAGSSCCCCCLMSASAPSFCTCLLTSSRNCLPPPAFGRCWE